MARKRGPKPATDVAAPEPVVGRPDPPDWLDGVALIHWDETIALVEASGLLSLVDRDALAAYCSLYAEWREAVEMTAKTKGKVITAKNGYRQQNPWHTIATNALKDMKPYLDMFGLHPKSRSKLKVPTEPPASDGKWQDFEAT